MALRGGRGVEADRSGSSDVQALRPTPDRDADVLVDHRAGSFRSRLDLGQPVRFAAEDPGRPGPQETVGVRLTESAGRRRGRAKDLKSGSSQLGTDLGIDPGTHDRKVEQAAGAGSDTLAVVRVHRTLREDHRISACGVSRTKNRARIARIGDASQDSYQPCRPTHDPGDRDIEEAATRDQALRMNRFGQPGSSLVTDRLQADRRLSKPVTVLVEGGRRTEHLEHDTRRGNCFPNGLWPLGQELPGLITTHAPDEATGLQEPRVAVTQQCGQCDSPFPYFLRRMCGLHAG